uniref:TROVE domain-containing protein n=1 Tax=Anabas testudineus TaxID=64144 RepID=A0A3Q1K384_ANATE
FRQEEFAEFDGRIEKTEEALNDKKVGAALICITHFSMVDRACLFFLPIQVAVYTRQKLNYNITANFLLALAASQPTTKPHVRRYFCAAVQLPSDWLEVVRIYCTVSISEQLRSLPTCLKKAMADKFKQFSEYQLAKYNTRKHRCKHRGNRHKGEVQKLCHFPKCPVIDDLKMLQGSKETVDKKQSDFSMKTMIKRLHIREPAEHVMAILGKKYPADLKTFTRSGMKGEWDRERAGQRMKLKEPQTWEHLISLEGNTAATWEKLIDNKSLPFMAMLRNLRNMITKGISEAHHKKILSRLTSKKEVIQSRQFPFRFLVAYKVIMELHTLGKKQVEYDANQRQYTVELLDQYREALEAAVQISCRYNVPPLPGRTVLMFYAPMKTCTMKLDFCLPPDPEENKKDEDGKKQIRRRKKKEEKKDKLSPSVRARSAGTRRRLTYKLFISQLVAERGSTRMLDHVENLDKVYKIPPLDRAKDPQPTDTVVPTPTSPKLRWRGVRVFISSTFRDMHAERDVLVRSIFPELSRRAAAHCLFLQEVELRWGVTEEESGRATELCLSEVCRSQMMVGILGERYGVVPPKPALPDLPQYSWLASAPPCLSITEMEIRQFQALYPDTAHQQMFCYFRDPNITKSVPVAWRSDFVPESKEAEAKMSSLKNRIRDSGSSCLCPSYPCEWGGVLDGKPYLKNLEDFGKAVLEDLWTAVEEQFVEVDLVSEFHSTLSDMKKNKPLVLLVDGVDVVHNGRGQVSSDWIPQQLPQGVCLVLSITTKAALLQTLAKKRGVVLFTLGQLTMMDRKEIVQRGLDTFGKKLSDSAFNNQVLLVSPLYLHLACEDLRNFASFDKVRCHFFAIDDSANTVCIKLSICPCTKASDRSSHNKKNITYHKCRVHGH